ncbi:MAG: ABC transporter permease subunit [Beijerinckiaceae bacterium]
MLRRLLYDAKIRDAIYQVALIAALVLAFVWFVRNASQNLVNAGIASGFDFLWRTSGIDVPFVLTNYTSQSQIIDLMWVGVVNTLLVTLLAMIGATLLGFIIGLGRLSSHWLVARVAGAYVEGVRNIPLLFFVLFWYFGVIAALPAPRQSIGVFGVAFLNNRGLTIPVPTDPYAFRIAALVCIAALAGAWLAARRARAERDAKGDTSFGWIAGALAFAVPVIAFVIAAMASSWDIPALRGFNYRGGFVLVPEFVALLAALVTYTAAFVAEIVRGGIEAVPRGQSEAANALGLTTTQRLRLVVVPQALRVMTPPMTSQYLNVLKNSSFGAAIAYPELVSVFMGSALNNTGQAIEIIAITLAIYLAIGLAVSVFMNWYNEKTKLVTR